MASVLAIVSKAQFEEIAKKRGGAAVGDVLDLDRYDSTHRALAPLERGGDLFLVTVRPDDVLWLVGVLAAPKLASDHWASAASRIPITDATKVKAKLRFENGKGVPTEAGKLAMSLQTPRTLTEADEQLLRSLIGAVQKPAAAASKPTNGDLGAARDALEAGDRHAALEALLAAWRVCRAPEIEEVVDVVSSDLVRAHPVIEATAKEFDAAWGGREKARDPSELPRLLDSLTHDPKGGLPLRLRALLEWPHDPRIGQKLLEMIDDPPITASSNFSMWTTLFSALPHYVDRRAEKRLRGRAKKAGGTSQFWPKLTAWIEKAVPQLDEPASVSDGDRVLLAAMKAQAEALAKTALPKRSAAIVEPRRSTEPTDALGEAERAIDAKDGVRALEALCAFWATRRAPAVAELVEALGHAIDETLPSIEVGKPAEIHAAWLAIGRTPKPADVGRLLASILAGKLSDAEERLAAVVQWPPDPRVGKKLAQFFADYMLGSRPVFWKLVYDAFVHHADPRQRDLVVKRADDLEDRPGFDRVRSERTQLRRIREPFIEACAQLSTLSPAESAAVERLRDSIGKWTAARRASADAAVESERALVRAIADAMDDDAPRSVYADWLSDKGDPRGEYMAMALADAAGTAKLKSKLTEIQKKHRAALLGPLTALAHETTFARGLVEGIKLAGVGIDWSDTALAERTVNDLRWCTLRTLELFLGNLPTRTAILSRAPLWALERLGDVSPADFAALVGREPMRHLKSVDFRFHQEDPAHPWPILANAELPALETIGASWFTAPPRAFFDVPAFRRVKALAFGSRSCGGELPLGDWLSRLIESEFPVPKVRVTYHRFTLEWAPGVAHVLFHSPVPESDARGLAQATATIESIRDLAVPKLEWSTDAGIELSPPMQRTLGSLGAVKRG